jgi:hypothetical protein
VTITDPLDLSTEQRRQALLGLAQRWTDILIDLGTGQRPIPFTLDRLLVASLCAPVAHPLLTLDRVADLMSVLAVAVTAQDRYATFGTWDDEDDAAMSGRDEEQREHFLASNVEWALFPLLHATEPCLECQRHGVLGTWRAKTTTLLCAEHAIERRILQDSWANKRVSR